jgi:hypothetical protein
MITPEPNKWCSLPGKPAFMYLPVPETGLSASQKKAADIHLDFWKKNLDWDAEKQEGFWMYTYYKKHLPEKYKYLADRIMNSDYIDLRQSFEAIIGLIGKDIADPYEERIKEAPVRL